MRIQNTDYRLQNIDLRFSGQVSRVRGQGVDLRLEDLKKENKLRVKYYIRL
jgi:hypothetical protein